MTFDCRATQVTTVGDGKTPWAQDPGATTLPASDEYLCLHHDGTRLGALAKTDDGYALYGIDATSGAATKRLALPSYAPMEPAPAVGGGPTECAFSPSTGMLAVLFRETDPDAAAYVQAKTLGLVTIDTRNLTASPAAAPVAFPFGGGGDAGGREWRSIGAGIGFER